MNEATPVYKVQQRDLAHGLPISSWYGPTKVYAVKEEAFADLKLWRDTFKETFEFRFDPTFDVPDEEKVLPHQRVVQTRPQDTLLTQDKKARKETPITTGVVDYFPRALAEVARVSFVGNQQHNPGQSLHWDKTKSMDHPDCIGRHLIERGKLDDDGMRHSAKLAWRALALLELELEAAQ